MPVKTMGNPGSDVFLVLLPGGPSGDGLVYERVFPFFKNYLEPHYRVVYYDQRGAGNCQGTYDSERLNLNQLSEDLDQVVRTISEVNENATIFLLGYSYGGSLGATYLLNHEAPAALRGFISIAGAFDRSEQGRNQQRLTVYLLDKWVEEGYIDSYEYLEEGFRCADLENPEQCAADSIRTLRKVEAGLDELGAYGQFDLSFKSIAGLLSFALFSQSNPIASGLQEGQCGGFFQTEFDTLTLSRHAARIKTPTLLINGRYDTNVPFFDAQRMYDSIGTSDDQKELVILEQSGHLPMQTEPQRLGEAIIRFIEGLLRER